MRVETARTRVHTRNTTTGTSHAGLGAGIRYYSGVSVVSIVSIVSVVSVVSVISDVSGVMVERVVSCRTVSGV